MMQEAGIVPELPDMPADIDVAIRSGNGKLIYILTNYGKEQQTIKLPVAMQDVLNGSKVSEVTLSHYGVAVLQR
jgi:beta-galactosidase